MADASLTVKMALDRLALKQGLEGAGKDVDGFKKHFESSLRETRGAVKDVAGSIDGIGRAFEGSIGGAISGLRDLMQLIPVAPWAAMGTAAAGAFTAIAKGYEELINKVADSEDKATSARQKNIEKFRKAIGIKSATDKALEGTDSDATKIAAQRTLEILNLTEKIAENTRKVSVLKQSEIFWADEIKKINEETAQLEEQRGKFSEDLIKLNEKLDKSKTETDKKRAEAGKKFFEDEVKRLEDLETKRRKIEDDEARANYKKMAQKADAVIKESEERKKAQEDIAELYKRERKEANFASGIDIYQKMGGRVGSNLDVG